MDLSPLIAPFVFVAVARLSSQFNIKPLVLSFLAIVPPFLFILITRFIYIAGYELPFFANFISVTDLIVLALQVIVAFFVFRKLSEVEDSLFDWFAWTIGSLLVVVYLLPFIVRSFMTL